MYLQLKFVDVIKTLLMFSVFVGFGSIISSVSPISSDLLTFFLVFLLLLTNKKIKIKYNLLRCLILIYVITFFLSLLSNSFFLDYAGIYFRITLTFLLITAFKNDYFQIKKHIVRAFWIISYLALINFFLALIIPMHFVGIETANGIKVQTLGYIFNYMSEIEFLGIRTIRNQGMFWEPGVLQIPMTLLIYYLLIEQNKRIVQVLLPMFIILTTFSTSGFICLIFLIAVKLIKEFSVEGKRIGFLKILYVLMIILVSFPFLIGEINNKFNSEEGSMSTTARFYDLYMSVEVIKENPLFGLGINEEKYLKEISRKSVTVNGDNLNMDRGNTNGILSMFIKFGIPVSLLLLYLIYDQNIFKYRLVFFVVILISLMSEPLVVVYFVILLFMSSNSTTTLIEKKKITSDYIGD